MKKIIALFALTGIILYLFLRYILHTTPSVYFLPLYIALFSSIPLLYDLVVKFFKKDFGSDILAGIAIITSVLLGEYLAGAIVVLMLAGGQSLENYAIESASSILKTLSKRIPNLAHQKHQNKIVDTDTNKIAIGDSLIVYPHEICPVDGIVTEGHGVMDETYLTGEPFQISKTPGAAVLSGAVNGETPLTIRAIKLPKDSRYAKIMEVMRRAEEDRPRIRRLGDSLGAYYTPLAIVLAIAAWLASGNAVRFLAVLVVATPCPLLLAIPICIIGSISLAAKRGIIIRNPSVLEQIDLCKTIIFDKTGTLTYGIPHLSEEIICNGFNPKEVLKAVASLEQYSKHPLANAILAKARQSKIPLLQANEMSEIPGQGLSGLVSGGKIWITNRKGLLKKNPALEKELPPLSTGLECVVMIDEQYAATYRFCDTPRKESRSFVEHLGTKHFFKKIMLVSGDRESEVKYLADLAGIEEIHASQSPEEKVAIVRKERETAKTLFVGDGLNDAPALLSATVGVVLGQNSDVTTQAAGTIIMDSSLAKVDEFFHIGRRMRSIALQSAVGGMALSLVGMVFAMAGFLPPVMGAVAQEIIDIFAIANALRVALPPRKLVDFK